jgi:arabinogalactan endo-1,4-beta-galactosidase
MNMKVVLIITMVGLLSTWFYVSKLKQPDSKEEVIQALVDMLNQGNQRLSQERGRDYQAINQYPKILLKVKLNDYEKDILNGYESNPLRVCARLDIFARYLEKLGKRKEFFQIFKEDGLNYDMRVFNKYDKEILNEKLVLSTCPNFNQYL